MSGAMTSERERTGAQLLVANLAAQGTTHVFGVPGESYLPLLDALYDARERIRYVTCRQEGGAAYMAEASGKLTGRPGVAIVTRGPGATNAAIGVHVAQQDSTPMLLLVGQVGRGWLDREAFQEIDYRRMFGGIAKWVAQIDAAARVPEYVAHAFSVAMAGRPGPVVLALPEDMLAENATCADVERVEPLAQAADPAEVARAHALLERAERPLVIAGGSRWDAQACAALAAYAADNALPVATGLRRQDLFDNRHPSFAGDVGIGINPKLASRVREADVLLVVGESLVEMTSYV
jgi:acetolactate synthase-1/2/3 large subunit